MKHPMLYGVYLVRFPFVESEESKLRPVVVVGRPIGEYGITVVVPISSKLEVQAVDFLLDDWQASGLLRPSVARVHRITSIVQENIESYLGCLSATDKESMKDALRNLLICE
jgi:mRNA-degrading endonuclease toxin of MazEF toxin-antitoxin module